MLLVIRDYLSSNVVDEHHPFNDGSDGAGTVISTVLRQIFGKEPIVYESLYGYAKRVSLSKLHKEGKDVEALIKKHNPDKVLLCGKFTHAYVHGDSRAIALSKVRGLLVKKNNILFITTVGVDNLEKNYEVFRDFTTDALKLYNAKDIPPAPVIERVIVNTPQKLIDELAYISNASAVSLDIETSNFEKSTPSPFIDEIYAIGLGAAKRYGHTFSLIIPYTMLTKYKEQTVRALRHFIDTYDGEFVLHNALFDIQFLIKFLDYDFLKTKIVDTMLAAYALDERTFTDRIGGISLKVLSQEYFNIPDYSFSWNEFYGLPDDKKDWDSLYYYLGFDTHCTILLKTELENQLQDDPKLQNLLTTLLYPATVRLAHVTLTGMPVDISFLEKAIHKYTQIVKEQFASIKTTLPELYEWLKDNAFLFNPNTPKDIKRILSECYFVDVTKTDEATLSHITVYYPDDEVAQFAQRLLEYRKYSKILGTYLEPLRKMASIDGRIHGNFLLHGTKTGRLSSNNPNLQNIPKTDNYLVRKAFIAPKGYKFVEVDYSQLELRVMAILSEDENLKQVYVNGEDLHAKTAAFIFHKDIKDVTKEERQLAKIFNFGIIYGRTAYGISNGREMQELEQRGERTMSKDEAQKAINRYMTAYPGIADYMRKQHIKADKEQYVESLFGRKRRFPLILRKWWWRIQNQAINMPDQSTAGDFTLWSLVTLFDKLYHKYGDKVQIINTVHDSLLLLINDEIREVALLDIVEIMTNPPVDTKCVPIVIDIDIGDNWGELEPYDKKEDV